MAKGKEKTFRGDGDVRGDCGGALASVRTCQNSPKCRLSIQQVVHMK